jgi:hypothetical protein|tara:strand:+ start:276 stop:1490 length:1215 start_codon:yes stop_codon:yes gene_type:complete
MGLGFFRAGLIAGGSAADIIRVADTAREDKFNKAVNDFVDNNVPKFMEARQKRVGIKNRLNEELRTVVSRFIKPAVGETVDVNSQYELAEKLLFDNGGKIENIDAKYKYEMMNSAEPKSYNATTFISNYFNGMPKGKEGSRTVDQIITSRANQLAPDPTIDLEGKAEALAGYKDSVFFKMDRGTVADRLKAATGYTGPVEVTTNPYRDITTTTPSADIDIIDQRKTRKLQQKSGELEIEAKKLTKAIGQYPVGKINDLFHDYAAEAYIQSGIKLSNNRYKNGKLIPLMDRPKVVIAAQQTALSQTISQLINDKSFLPENPTKSNLNVLPTIGAMVKGMTPKELPKKFVVNPANPTGASVSIVDEQALKIGMVYMDKDKRKYIYYATKPDDPSKVDVDKKYYFSK